MPFQVKWYVEGRVATVYNWGELTVDEVRATNQELLALVRSGTAPVHLVVDTLDVTRLPSSFVPMLKEIEIFRHEPNMGWSIMVTNSSVLHFFGMLSSNLNRTSYRALRNYREVNDLLKKVDPTLVDLLPESWETRPTP
jgi:hypothetical protein